MWGGKQSLRSFSPDVSEMVQEREFNAYGQSGKTPCLQRQLGADLTGRGLTGIDHSLFVTDFGEIGYFTRTVCPLRKAGSTERVAYEFVLFAPFHFLILNKHMYF